MGAVVRDVRVPGYRSGRGLRDSVRGVRSGAGFRSPLDAVREVPGDEGAAVHILREAEELVWGRGHVSIVVGSLKHLRVILVLARAPVVRQSNVRLRYHHTP